MLTAEPISYGITASLHHGTEQETQPNWEEMEKDFILFPPYVYMTLTCLCYKTEADGV